MPLRPVSELGLVDITDLPVRDRSRVANRGRSTGARRSSQPPRGDSVNDHPRAQRRGRAEGARATTGRKRDAGSPPAEVQRSDGKAKTRRSNPSTASPSERSRSRPKTARRKASGGGTPNAIAHAPKRSRNAASGAGHATTGRRQASAASRTNTNSASGESQRSRTGRSRGKTKPPSSAKIGMSVVIAASLAAGVVLFARAALRR